MRDGQRAGLRLSHAEQVALLERVPSLPRGVREAIFATPPSKSVMLTLDDLDDLAGHVAAGASRARDQKVKKALDRISTKIEKLLDKVRPGSRDRDRPHERLPRLPARATCRSGGDDPADAGKVEGGR